MYDDMTYIRKESNESFSIKKNIDGKVVYFGTYHSLRDAVMIRDYLMENDWSIDLKNEIIAYKQSREGELIKNNKREETLSTTRQRYSIFLKNIHRNNNGDYILQRDKVYYGKFDSLMDALHAREYFEDNDWSEECRDKFIRRLKRKKDLKYINEKNNKFQIQKSVNGESYSFGTYETLEEAQDARDYFESTGWNIFERFKFKKVIDKDLLEETKPYFQSNRLF